MMTEREFARNLGAVIQRKRETLKLNQDDLAAAVGISKERLQEIECGKASVGSLTLYRLAQKFETSSWLLMLEAECLQHPRPAQFVDFVDFANAVRRMFVGGSGVADRIMDLARGIGKKR